MIRLTSVDLFGLLLCGSAILEQVPQASWRTALFVAMAVGVFLLALLRGRVFVQRSFSDLALLAFVLLVLVSGTWAMMGGVTGAQWWRGAVPFCFLLFLFTIDRNEPAAGLRIARYICLASAVWLVRVVGELLYLIATGQYVYSARLTGQIVDSVIPFGLVALPLILGGVFKVRFGLHFLLGAGLFVVALLAGYRSQSAIVLLQCAVIAIRALARPGQMARLAFFVAGALVVALLFGEQASRAVIERFQSTSADFETSRLAEWKYSLGEFAAKPLLGRGIGWQVPAEVTFDGAIEKLLEDGVELPDSAGYVHNVTAYLLMDLGLVGLLAYYAFSVGASLGALVRRSADRAARNLRLMVLLALASMLLYFQVQAAFRLVQVNLLIVAMLAILGSHGRSGGPRPGIVLRQDRASEGTLA